jgi:MYXO-CTERM domain-containing protein
MFRIWFLAWAVLGCLALASPVHAGPIELFRDVLQNPLQKDNLALKYIYGGAGVFLSADAGASWKLLPYSGIDAKIVRDDASVVQFGPDALLIGVFSGLWRGDANGCNWQEVPELKGKYVAAIAQDPLEPKRSYVATSNGSPAQNGIWMNDGSSATWTQHGITEELFWNTLHVVENGGKRRFYVTGVKNIPREMTDEVHYYVRYSDDEGQTWTSNEFDQLGTERASFDIIAIDPNDPNHVLGYIDRPMNGPDDLYSSMENGKPGSWTKVASVGELQAVTFTPDGKLYFGDNLQDTPGLFVVDSPGAAPRQFPLERPWKVSCLHWDAPRERMLGCNDIVIGTVDLTSGVLTTTFDMREAATFTECSGEPPMSQQCEVQLVGAYCGETHFPQAPVCSVYPRPGLMSARPDLFGGSGGIAMPVAGGPGGIAPPVAGSAARGGGPAVAGASAGAAASGGGKSSSGCSCTAAGGDERASGGALLCVLGLALAWRRRRARA